MPASRRALLKAGATGATAALAGCLNRAGDTPSGATEDGTDPEGMWPTFQYDTGRTGAISAGSPPSSDIGTDWEFTPKHHATASPVVSKGSVYVGDATRVYAVDRIDGSERWRFKLGTPDGFQVRDTVSTCFGQGAFALDDERLYVGSCTGFYALSTEDGEVSWYFERAPIADPLYEARNRRSSTGSCTFRRPGGYMGSLRIRERFVRRILSRTRRSPRPRQ